MFALNVVVTYAIRQRHFHSVCTTPQIVRRQIEVTAATDANEDAGLRAGEIGLCGLRHYNNIKKFAVESGVESALKHFLFYEEKHNEMALVILIN